MKWKEWNE